MKKNLLFCALASLAMLASCNHDSYRHGVNVVYPSAMSLVFGDQTSDSILFTTFDSFQATSYDSDWIEVLSSSDYPSSGKIPNNYYNYYLVRVNLKMQPNTGTKSRNGYVAVRSYSDDWEATAHGYYKQLPCHNVVRPYGIPVYQKIDGNPNDSTISTYRYEITDSARQVVDTLRFEAYDGWTLELPEDGFVKSAKTSGNKGYQVLLVDLEQNPSEQSRTTTVQLKSNNGVTTPITFIQKGIKKPANKE